MLFSVELQDFYNLWTRKCVGGSSHGLFKNIITPLA